MMMPPPVFVFVATLVTAIATAVPNKSADDYIYWTAYSKNDECADGSLVGIKGVVTLEESTSAGRMPAGNTCAVEMACLYESDSERCKVLEPALVATGLFVSDNEGHVFACDSTNFFEGEPSCSKREQGQCFTSSLYKGCNARYAVTSNFQDDPDFFSNSNANDLMDMQDHYYIAFYSDEKCSELAGIRAFYSEETYNIPVTGDNVSCVDAMACLFNPNGASCMDRKEGNQIAQFFDKTGGDVGKEVYECGEPNSKDCNIVNPGTCLMSGIFSQCHQRKVSATFLATNPKYLIGVHGTDTQANNGVVSLGTSKSRMSTYNIVKAVSLAVVSYLC